MDSKKLRQLRHAAGLSKVKMAKELGMCTPTYKKYEDVNEKKDPSEIEHKIISFAKESGLENIISDDKPLKYDDIHRVIADAKVAVSCMLNLVERLERYV